MSKEEKLAKALAVGREDVVSMMAVDLFFDEKGNENTANISSFEKLSGSQVFVAKTGGKSKTSGFIRYNSTKYYFS